MKSPDTEMGGENRAFRTTMWTEILAAGDPTGPACRGHLDHLIQAYWKPVFSYVRSVWGTSVEDAKDLTQSFFTMMVEKEYWSRLTPEKGSFRSYLKRALHNFLINAKRNDAVRRPEGPMISLNAPSDELEALIPAGPNETPEGTLDRVWMQYLLKDSMAELKTNLDREGKSVYFEVFQIFFGESDQFASKDPLQPAKVPSYQEVAARLQIKVPDVWNHLVHCRKALRRILRDRIREYAGSEEEVERELRELAGE